MSEHINTQTKINDKFKKVLSGDKLKVAQDFVAHLFDIGMTPLNDEDGSVRFGYKGQLTCIIIFWQDCWIICDAPASDCEGFQVDDDLKEFAKAHVKTCNVFKGNPCGCGNEPGKGFIVFGENYENICTSELEFFDPGAEILENVKKLMDLWVHKIDNIDGYNSQDR
ncbi:MAG: hypothetical protein FWC78_00750 [Defluviitaleaceae bacterium]|nr:hypothetical protein [Defluviitaleaceae bacterium]